MAILPFLFLEAEKNIVDAFKSNNANSIENAISIEKLNIDFKKNPTMKECFRDMQKKKQIKSDNKGNYWM